MSQSSHNIILRISSRAGITRMSVSVSADIRSVKAAAAERFSVNPSEVNLVYHSRILGPDGAKIGTFGIQNGDEIFLNTAANAVASLNDAKLPTTNAKVMTTSDLPPMPQTSGSNLTSSSSQSQSNTQAQGGNTQTNAPVFQSFDDFLRKHDYNTSVLAGSLSYKPTTFVKGEITKLPPSVTLKHQPYRHVDHLEFMNVSEANEFVRYWVQDMGMTQPRVGFLYGYYKEDHHYPLGIRAVVEGIYEPPQAYGNEEVKIIEDGFHEVVGKVAERLSLEPIGYIFTHLPRDELLTAKEVMQMAKMQMQHANTQHYTGYPVTKFVTCTITPCAKEGGEPVPNAFMISDMGLAFQRDNLYDTNCSQKNLKLRQPAKNEVYPEVLESGKSAREFDADWFIVRVNESAPKKVRSRFKHASFMRENRRAQASPKDIQIHMKKMPASEESWQKICDFHLLLYIARLFDVEMALSICDCIHKEEPIDSWIEDTLMNLE